MKTTLILSVLLLALCIGCKKAEPQTENDDSPAPNKIETNTLDTSEPPLVEPLVPKVDPPEEPASVPESAVPEATAPEIPVLETTGIVSQSLGKYGVEMIPLPPVDDLTAQADEYITKIGTNLDILDSNTRYANDSADIVRDANALSLVVLAIGLSDADSKYKKSAPQIIAAANTLADAKTLDEGQKAFAALKSSLTAPDDTPLSWSNKIADLTPLMKAVPNLNATVKRLTNTERKLKLLLERKPQQVNGALAALAAISQGSIANASETTKPEAAAEWKKFCEEMRDAALKANAVTHQFAEQKVDYVSFKTALEAINASCDHCHEVFYPSAIGQ